MPRGLLFHPLGHLMAVLPRGRAGRQVPAVGTMERRRYRWTPCVGACAASNAFVAGATCGSATAQPGALLPYVSIRVASMTMPMPMAMAMAMASSRGEHKMRITPVKTRAVVASPRRVIARDTASKAPRSFFLLPRIVVGSGARPRPTFGERWERVPNSAPPCLCSSSRGTALSCAVLSFAVL